MLALDQSEPALVGGIVQSPLGRGAAKLLAALRELAFPPGCPACGAGLKNQGPFCAACGDEVQLLTGPGHSARSMGNRSGSGDAFGASGQSFKSAQALAVYGGPVGKALRGFKYNRHLASGSALAKWLAREIPAEWLSGIDLIAPVPLHPRRLISRGFNQAVLLFRPLSQKYDIPLAANLVARLRNTRPQVDLPPRERQDNVAGAFGLRKPGQTLERKVLLVDDVYTTGATVNECSRALLQAGAAQVRVLTLARTARGGAAPA